MEYILTCGHTRARYGYGYRIANMAGPEHPDEAYTLSQTYLYIPITYIAYVWWRILSYRISNI